MNVYDIEKMNDKITYDEGKIYWDHRKGYTSDLIKRLLRSGYTAVKVGAVHVLKDINNQEVVSGYSWEGLLYNTAIIMR
jgi:hypothetical protein